jgi:hypothetical protein
LADGLGAGLAFGLLLFFAIYVLFQSADDRQSIAKMRHDGSNFQGFFRFYLWFPAPTLCILAPYSTAQTGAAASSARVAKTTMRWVLTR